MTESMAEEYNDHRASCSGNRMSGVTISLRPLVVRDANTVGGVAECMIRV
jgi:hypothetical protein